MGNYFASILVLLALFIFSGGVLSQVQSKTNGSKILLEEFKDRPALGTDISKIAKFKIFLPKQLYHLQEIMILDMGLLIDDQASVFFDKNLSVRIIIHDESKNRISIDNIYTVDVLPRYEKLNKTIIKDSELMLIGCENKIMDDLNSLTKVFASDDLMLGFEKSIFRTSPQSCIDINKAAKLEIYAEVYNDLVVVAPNKESYKTAVGKIKSNILTINIKE